MRNEIWVSDELSTLRGENYHNRFERLPLLLVIFLQGIWKHIV